MLNLHSNYYTTQLKKEFPYTYILGKLIIIWMNMKFNSEINLLRITISSNLKYMLNEAIIYQILSKFSA